MQPMEPPPMSISEIMDAAFSIPLLTQSRAWSGLTGTRSTA